MREPQFRPRLVLASLVLLALAVSGCVGVSAPVSTPAPQASSPAPAEQATQQPSAIPGAATANPAVARDIPAGVDADGNFYRGDPNAAVKLVEWSDFQ